MVGRCTHSGLARVTDVERAGAITVESSCTSATRRRGSGTYYARRHTFTLDSPGWVTIDLANSASNPSRLDTYLILLSGHGGGGTQIDSDDDSGNSTDSRLADIFLEEGQYTIEATTYRTTATGHYRLRVDATVTGLKPRYDAYAGRELVVKFQTGSFVPTASVPASGLTATASRSGSTASLSVTPSRTGTLGVNLSFSRSAEASGSSSRSTRSVGARAAAAFGTYNITFSSTCPAGQKPNPNPPAGTC